VKSRKLNFEIDSDKSSIVDDYNSTTLTKVRMHIVSEGNNSHNMPITKESIELAKSTLVGKPILAHYIPFKDDLGGHDPQQVPVGCFISEDDMEIIVDEDDNKTWLVADGYIWKKYYPEVVDVFKKKDGETSVSMEIEVLETENRMDGYNETLTLWNFSGVTLLGVKPSIKNARANILTYSEEQKEIVIDNIVEKTRDIVFGEKIFEVPIEVSENAKNALELAKRLNRKTDTMFLHISDLLANSDKLAFEHVETIYNYLNGKEDFAKEKRNTNNSIFFNGYGGIDGLYWSKEIIESFGINDDVGDKDSKELSKNSGADKNNNHRKENKMSKNIKNFENQFWKFQADGNVGNLYLRGEVTDFSWWGEDAITPKDVREQIFQIGEVELLNVYINSPGGDVFAGETIYHMLKQMSCPVHVYIDVMAASIASVIAMAGEKIYMYENAIMMIHKASTLAWGNSDDFEKSKKVLEVIDNSIINIYKDKTKMNKEDIEKMLKEETWMSAEEAVNLGFADEVKKLTEEEIEEVGKLELEVVTYEFAKKFNNTPEQFLLNLKNEIIDNKNDLDSEKIKLKLEDAMNKIETLKNKLESDEEKYKNDISNLENEKTILADKVSEYEAKIQESSNELDILREYKANQEKEIFESKTNTIIVSAKEVLSEDNIKALQDDIVNYNFETIELFENKVKAMMCDVLMSQEKEYKFEKVPLHKTIKERHSGSIWDEIEAKNQEK
jgi:ATP-dependent Clp protease protease subunit